MAVSLGLNKDQATIFPWGIDPRRFHSGKSEMRDQVASPDDFVLLSLRSLEPNYDVATTIKAFLQATAIEPALKLLMLGDGSQLASLKNLALSAPESIQKRILWLGRKPNDQLVDAYRAADLYLSASITDGSSVSLLEAMACELPVLVSAIPGNLEWVAEGETGFLFQTGNAEEMADKILWCYRNPSAVRLTAVNARRQIEEKADWDKNKFRLTDAYQGAIRVSHDRNTR